MGRGVQNSCPSPPPDCGTNEVVVTLKGEASPIIYRLGEWRMILET